MSQLTKNTTDLDALIAKANALPDTGASSGNIKTCTVTITFNETQTHFIYIPYINDGQLAYYTWSEYFDHSNLEARVETLEVPCGAVIFFHINRPQYMLTVTNLSIIRTMSGYYEYAAPLSPGSEAAITIP